jgi:hypothetical protein
MARTVKTEDPLVSVVVKYIPTEIVGAFLAVQGLIVGLSGPLGQWTMIIVSGALLVLTPLYLAFVQGVRQAGQLIVTTISFVVWLYTLQGPFKDWGIYDATIGSVVLILWTLIIPVIAKPRKT